MVTQEVSTELTPEEMKALGPKIERFARELSPSEQRFLQDALKHAGLWLYLDTSMREDDPAWWGG
jgi:hypothetical protein